MAAVWRRNRWLSHNSGNIPDIPAGLIASSTLLRSVQVVRFRLWLATALASGAILAAVLHAQVGVDDTPKHRASAKARASGSDPQESPSPSPKRNAKKSAAKKSTKHKAGTKKSPTPKPRTKKKTARPAKTPTPPPKRGEPVKAASSPSPAPI